jgi:hypothetical protein
MGEKAVDTTSPDSDYDLEALRYPMSCRSGLFPSHYDCQCNPPVGSCWLADFALSSGSSFDPAPHHTQPSIGNPPECQKSCPPKTP